MGNPVLLADLLLFFHFAYVLAVILPVPMIVAGGILGWGWVRNRIFRIVHVAMIVVVVINSVLGNLCPLTTLEFSLRSSAGTGEHLLPLASIVSSVLYYEAPLWQFAVAYALFGSLIIGLWFLVPPRSRQSEEISSFSTSADNAGMEPRKNQK